jgi:hypothetical protein
MKHYLPIMICGVEAYSGTVITVGVKLLCSIKSEWYNMEPGHRQQSEGRSKQKISEIKNTCMYMYVLTGIKMSRTQGLAIENQGKIRTTACIPV